MYFQVLQKLACFSLDTSIFGPRILSFKGLLHPLSDDEPLRLLSFDRLFRRVSETGSRVVVKVGQRGAQLEVLAF